MKDRGHNIDEIFYEGAENHQEFPGEAVWNRIETELDKDAATVYKRKYRQVRMYAAALLFLLVGIISFEAWRFIRRDHAKITEQPDGASRNAIAPDETEHTRNTKMPATGQPDAGLTGTIINTKSSEEILIQKVQSRVETSLNNTVEPEFIAEDHAAAVVTDAQTENSLRNQEILQFAKPRLGGLSLQKHFAEQPEINSLLKKQAVPFTPKSKWSLTVFANVAAPDYAVVEDEDYRRGRRRGGGSGSAPGAGGGGSGGGSGGGPGGGGSGGGTSPGVTPAPAHHHYRNIRQTETALMSYTVGARASYALGKKFSLTGGLAYMTAGTKAKPKMIYAEKDDNGDLGYRLNCSSGYMSLEPKSGATIRPGDSLLVSDTRSALAYLSVPVSMEYKVFSAGRFSLRAAAGAQANFLLSAKTNTIAGKGTVNELEVSSKTEGLKPLYLSAITRLEAEMKLGQKVSVIVAPTAQLGLSNVNANTTVKTRANYFGTSAGIKFKL